MGKGSTLRPFAVSNQEYSNRWDAIFGRDNEKNNQTQEVEPDRPSDTCHSGGSNHSEGQTGSTQTT